MRSMKQGTRCQRSPLLLRVGRLAVVILTVIGTLEVGLRLLWLKQLVLRAGIEHPHFHHRLKPYESYHFFSNEFDVTIKTNQYGLRGPDPAIPKPPGVIRILMLGDSFTFGFPVQDHETFSALIEQGLNTNGYPVEVIDGGVSGYSPTLEYISLRDEFLRFEPDLVILWYDRGDLQEDHWFQKNLIRDETGTILRCDPRYINGRWDWWGWLKHHSALAKYIDLKGLRTAEKIRVLGFWGYLKTKLRGERAKVAMARVKAQQRAPDLAASDRFLLLRDTATEEMVRPHWKLSEQYLLMIRDLLAERNIPFFVGLYPYGVSAGPDQWAEGRTAWGFEKGRLYEPRLINVFLGELATKHRIPVIRTLEDFRQAAKAEKLYYDWDGHFTPAGHRVLAEHVLRDTRVLAILKRIAQAPSDRKPIARSGLLHEPVDAR